MAMVSVNDDGLNLLLVSRAARDMDEKLIPALQQVLPSQDKHKYLKQQNEKKMVRDETFCVCC